MKIGRCVAPVGSDGRLKVSNLQDPPTTGTSFSSSLSCLEAPVLFVCFPTMPFTSCLAATDPMGGWGLVMDPGRPSPYRRTPPLCSPASKQIGFRAAAAAARPGKKTNIVVMVITSIWRGCGGRQAVAAVERGVL